jgi:hypothetical protein
MTAPQKPAPSFELKINKKAHSNQLDHIEVLNFDMI